MQSLMGSFSPPTPADMVGSIIAIIALALAYEGLKSVREFLMVHDQKIRQRNKKTPCLKTQRTNVQTLNENSSLICKEKQSPPW